MQRRSWLWCPFVPATHSPRCDTGRLYSGRASTPPTNAKCRLIACAMDMGPPPRIPLPAAPECGEDEKREVDADAHLHAPHLTNVSSGLLERAGAPAGSARAAANCIVENCLYGHDSHGMALLPRFVADIESGKIDPAAQSEVVSKGPAAALVLGHRGFGQITMTDAMHDTHRIGSPSRCLRHHPQCRHFARWHAATVSFLGDPFQNTSDLLQVPVRHPLAQLPLV